MEEERKIPKAGVIVVILVLVVIPAILYYFTVNPIIQKHFFDREAFAEEYSLEFTDNVRIISYTHWAFEIDNDLLLEVDDLSEFIHKNVTKETEYIDPKDGVHEPVYHYTHEHIYFTVDPQGDKYLIKIKHWEEHL